MGCIQNFLGELATKEIKFKKSKKRAQWFVAGGALLYCRRPARVDMVENLCLNESRYSQFSIVWGENCLYA